jgi:hypothetical protein
MFPANYSRDDMIAHLATISPDTYRKFHYCLNMGFTYLSMAALESTIIDLMTMCNAVQVKTVLEEDAEGWRLLLAKRGTLEQSTLGSLVKILSAHIAAEDLHYLKFIKAKRDDFVHRFFHHGEWPGDLDANGCEWATRRLLAMNIIFDRAKTRFVGVLMRNGLFIGQPMSRRGEDGILLMNPDFFENFGK